MAYRSANPEIWLLLDSVTRYFRAGSPTTTQEPPDEDGDPDLSYELESGLERMSDEPLPTDLTTDYYSAFGR